MTQWTMKEVLFRGDPKGQTQETYLGFTHTRVM